MALGDRPYWLSGGSREIISQVELLSSEWRHLKGVPDGNGLPSFPAHRLWMPDSAADSTEPNPSPTHSLSLLGKGVALR